MAKSAYFLVKNAGLCVVCGENRGNDGTKARCRPCADKLKTYLKIHRVEKRLRKSSLWEAAQDIKTMASLLIKEKTQTIHSLQKDIDALKEMIAIVNSEGLVKVNKQESESTNGA